jgi:putative peptidoglycan binding protein
LTITGCLRVTMATGIVIGTGIAPTLITVTSLFLPTASGGDFIHGITILTTLTALIPRITLAIPTATKTIRTTALPYYNQDPYSYYNGYTAPAQSSNGVVSSVQSQLSKLGYYRGAIDGVAGDETQAAIARYQEDNDLSVTGTVTAATLQSLGLAGR